MKMIFTLLAFWLIWAGHGYSDIHTAGPFATRDRCIKIRDRIQQETYVWAVIIDCEED